MQELELLMCLPWLSQKFVDRRDCTNRHRGVKIGPWLVFEAMQ